MMEGYEMDRSRYRRPAIQTQRQTQKAPLGSYSPVPRAGVTRPLNRLSSRRQAMDLLPVPPVRPAVTRPSLSALAVAASLDQPTGYQPRRQPLDMELPGETSQPRFNLR